MDILFLVSPPLFDDLLTPRALARYLYPFLEYFIHLEFLSTSCTLVNSHECANTV